VQANQEALVQHAIVLEQIAILLRTQRRVPERDISGLSQLDKILSESASEVLSHSRDDDAATLNGSPSNFRNPRNRIPRNLASTIPSNSLEWSKFMIDDITTPIFRLYTDVVFEFITENWSEDGTIGVAQLRDFHQYAGIRGAPPSEEWLLDAPLVSNEPTIKRTVSQTLWGHVYSTAPLKLLYDTAGVTYVDSSILRKCTSNAPGTWKIPFDDFRGFFTGFTLGAIGHMEKKYVPGRTVRDSFTDSSPVLEKLGWHQWMKTLLCRDPTTWYQDHMSVVSTLP
jgi:hypothetical protein